MAMALRPRGTGSDQQVSPRPLRPGGGVGPVPLWPLVCLQAAGASLMAAWVADSGPWSLLAGLLAGALVVLAVVRPQGRPLPELAGLVLALRRRQRGAAGPLPPGTDPLVSLAMECVPTLRSYSVEGDDRRDIGMAGDGGTLTAVLRVEAAQSPLQPGREAQPLPLSLLYEALDTDGIRLASVQVVQHTRPAPARHLPEEAAAGRAYAPLHASSGAPGLRLTWVTLRLDPELCPGAVAERGGGLQGSQRAVRRAADQLASRLSGAGLRTTVLSRADVLGALAACVNANPTTTTLIGLGDGPRPRRTLENARSWRCDDRRHTTYEVTRWPDLAASGTSLPALAALLTSVPTLASTFAVTLSPDGASSGRDTVTLGGHVRVTASDEGELRAAERGLRRTARAVRVGLARMDHEQLSGLRATVPLGGVH